MAKYVSKENLETILGAVKTKLDTKITDPGNGAVGQILVKTDNGTEWATPEEVEQCMCIDLTEPELDTILKGKEEEDATVVDLGLPSGLLWATCNLGAEKETDNGLYFQWGDTKGYKGPCRESESEGNDDLHYFGTKTYKYYDLSGGSAKLTKYCTNPDLGSVDNKTFLEPEDDAATVMLGGGWRIPDKQDFQELIDNTEPGDGANEYGWVYNYNGSGANGMLRKSKVNNNTIFFPANDGYKMEKFIEEDSDGNQDGNYWARNLRNYGEDISSSYCDYAHHMDFYGWGLTPTSSWDRACGMGIRAVKSVSNATKPKQTLTTPNLSYKLTGADSVLVTWDPVENADYYEYEVDATNESGTTEETQLNITNLIMGEPYKVTVAACSNNEEFEQSKQAEVSNTQPDVGQILNYFKPVIKDLNWGQDNNLNKNIDFYFPPEALELSTGLVIPYQYDIDDGMERGSFNITNGWNSLTSGRGFNYKTPAGQHTTVYIKWELTDSAVYGITPLLPKEIYDQIKGEVTYDVVVGEDYHMNE